MLWIVMRCGKTETQRRGRGYQRPSTPGPERSETRTNVRPRWPIRTRLTNAVIVYKTDPLYPPECHVGRCTTPAHLSPVLPPKSHQLSPVTVATTAIFTIVALTPPEGKTTEVQRQPSGPPARDRGRRTRSAATGLSPSLVTCF